MDLFEKTRRLATEKGMSLTSLAEEAGLSQKTIYRWRYAQPKAETLEKVAKILNVSVDYLLGNIPKIEILNFSTPVKTSWNVPGEPELGGQNIYLLITVSRTGIAIDPEKVVSLKDDDEVVIIEKSEEVGYESVYNSRNEYVLSYGELSNLENENVLKRFENYEVKILNDAKLAIDKELIKRSYKQKHVDLWELIQDDDHNKYVDANGHKLTFDDWALLHKVLSKYRDREQK